MNDNHKEYHFDEIMTKLRRFCSYQERSRQEVIQKAKSFKLSNQKIEEAIQLLERDKFIDELRFVMAFTNGKINQKHWGKYKIKAGLIQKGIASDLIDSSLAGIDESRWAKNLQYWINYKLERANVDRKNVDQLYRFLFSKGFETSDIKEQLKNRNLV